MSVIREPILTTLIQYYREHNKLIIAGILGLLLFIVVVISSIAKNGKFNHKSTTVSSKQINYKSEINWIGHWKGEGKREQLVTEIANEFEFLHQDIKVNLKFPEEVYFNINNGNDAEIAFIVSQITSPNPSFDIIRLKNHYEAVGKALHDPNWGKKYLVDFSEFPEFVKTQQSLLFTPEYESRNGGITIGPYNEGFFWALWFNKELADKIGIKVKQYGMTPEDFVDYIKATDTYNKKNNTDIVPLFEEANWTTSDMLMYNMFYSLVGNYEELKKNTSTPKKMEDIQKILKVFEEISKHNPTFKDRSKINWLSNADYLLKGKCLFWTQGSWMYNIWDKNQENKSYLKNIYPAELPAYGGKSPCFIGGYSACWAVLKNAPHRENAIKLMTYWTRPEIAEKWARYTKCSTGVKGNLTATSFGFDQYEDFVYYLNTKYGAEHMFNNIGKALIFGEKNKDIVIPIMNVIEGKISAEKVMIDIKRQLK